MKKSYRNIYRFENPARSSFGWIVKVQRNYRTMQKSFCDNTYGGKKKALEAAFAYRDQCLLVEPFSPHKVWRCDVIRSNNTSGIPGVGRYDTQAGALRFAYWSAFWTDEHGKRHKKNFYVTTLGEKKARELAISARKQELKRMAALEGQPKRGGFELT